MNALSVEGTPLNVAASKVASMTSRRTSAIRVTIRAGVPGAVLNGLAERESREPALLLSDPLEACFHESRQQDGASSHCCSGPPHAGRESAPSLAHDRRL